MTYCYPARVIAKIAVAFAVERQVEAAGRQQPLSSSMKSDELIL
jgi:hypothetical protein